MNYLLRLLALASATVCGIFVTERYYAAWTESRQRQVEADLQRAWEHDPIVLLERKATRKN